MAQFTSNLEKKKGRKPPTMVIRLGFLIKDFYSDKSQHVVVITVITMFCIKQIKETHRTNLDNLVRCSLCRQHFFQKQYGC